MKGSRVEMSHPRQTTHNTLLPSDENPPAERGENKPYIIQVTMFRHDMTLLIIRKTSSVLIFLDLLDPRGSSVSKTENCVLICLRSRERLQIVLGLYGDFSLILA
jgi:hypothetical protein